LQKNWAGAWASVQARRALEPPLLGYNSKRLCQIKFQF